MSSNKKAEEMSKMSVYVLSVEKSEVEEYSSRTIGVYKTYNVAKAAAVEYVEESELEFKKKNPKKEESKKLLFQVKGDDYEKKLYIEEIEFEMPEVKKKTKKDPNAPKKGLSAYMFFAKETREQIKQSNPEAKFGEIGKLLGEAWKELVDKSKYEQLAKEDKVRYESEMGSEPVEVKPKKGKSKKTE
jgi:hypothetical protein